MDAVLSRADSLLLQPPRFRLLAFDLDGTLLGSDHHFAPEVVAFLDRARDCGVHLVPATGRRLYSALPLLRPVLGQGLCVVQNGAVLAEIASGRTVAAHYLEPAHVEELVAFLKARYCAPLIFTNAGEGPDEILLEEGAPDPTGFLARYLPRTRGHFRRVAALEQERGERVARVARVVTHHQEEHLEGLLQELGRLHLPVRAFVGLDPTHGIHRLEVLAPCADKGSAVRCAAARLDVPMEAVLAVGDDRNDVELLALAGHSYAAPGSHPDARAAACASVPGDGPLDVVKVLAAALGIVP